MIPSVRNERAAERGGCCTARKIRILRRTQLEAHNTGVDHGPSPGRFRGNLPAVADRRDVGAVGASPLTAMKERWSLDDTTARREDTHCRRIRPTRSVKGHRCFGDEGRYDCRRLG